MPATVVPVSRFARSLKKVASALAGEPGRAHRAHRRAAAEPARGAGLRRRPRALADASTPRPERYLGEMRRSLFLRGAFSPTVEVTGHRRRGAGGGVGARAVAAEPALAGRLLSFLAAALLLYQPVKSLERHVLAGAHGAGGGGAAVRDRGRAGAAGRGRRGRAAGAGAGAGGRARHVPGRARGAARAWTSRCRAGARVALVGASGAGKTTLFSVLLGFLPPSGGHGALGRRAAVGAEAARACAAQVAWVPQEPVLFSGTVRAQPAAGPAGGDRRGAVGGAAAGARGGLRARRCRAGWTSRWASAARGSPADSGSGWRWRGRSCAGPRCCCWTSPPARWTRRARRRWARGWRS